MATADSPQSEHSSSPFFEKLKQSVQKFSNLLFTSPEEASNSRPMRHSIQSCYNDIALHLEQVHIDEVSGSTRVVISVESDEDEEDYREKQNTTHHNQDGGARHQETSNPKSSTNPNVYRSRNYKNIILEPQKEEINSPPPNDIYRNLIQGSYSSPVHYLNIHFKLLREDFISPLREGIQQIRRDYTEYGTLHKNTDVTLYPNCKFISMAAKKKVVGYEFCFDVEHKMKVNQWMATRSLFNGTLLAFSSDNFKTFFFGFVVFTEFHDMLYRRVIIVELCNGRHLQYKEFGESYAMIEPSSFFAPYFHVMKTLQGYSNNNFPFEKYFVQTKKEISPPVYFSKCPQIEKSYDFTKEAQEDMGLNPTQFEAYKTAFTRELAIIQGPPGTGKTYVGLRIVETFLKNANLVKYMDGPILIICYTNHALDQFVEGVLKYTQNVIRLGYSKNNDKVKPYNYLEVIETFYAIKQASNAVKKGEKNKSVLRHDFDKIFSPDRWGKYTLLVRSFRTDAYEKRRYDAQLLKAYFYMYVDSPFNILKNMPKKKVFKACRGCEFHMEQISMKISLLNSLDGIVNVKHLEDFMDDVSLFVLKSPGCLVMWLTNNNYQLRLNQIREEKIVNNQISSASDSEGEVFDDWSSDDSMDRTEDVFFILDLGMIQNEIEDAQDLLQMLRTNQSRNEFVADSSEEETENKIEQLQSLCQLVRGTLFSLSNAQINMTDIESSIISQIKTTQDLFSMNLGDRWKLYWYWMEHFRRNLYTQMREISIKYKNVVRELEESIRNPELIEIMKTKDVVAMTTTKAAKIHSVLDQVKPKIVVIEEAAEVLEAHILASLSKHCEHVVLIGDHKQLRPRTSVHELSRDYNFDVSLFERMINNNLHHVTLEMQHRMRPEICELLTPSIYKKLVNHPSVAKLPHIKGMPKNVLFFDHKVVEGKHLHETSTWNSFEVNILLNLSDYLLEQGYTKRDITIIAAYRGQVELFEETVSSRFPHLINMRITTIDAYQGEENKIILLSLVRSNAHNNIGFLKTANRVCVALSRAQQGLFIMGNIKCLTHDSELWQHIKRVLVARRAINDNFRLQCEKHRTVTIIRTDDDFDACCCLRR
uniref:NFX1-type zinc finger-containing protein 1 n=1 Tax=Cacopsylla melanoneura TaxID=428564 RepID=A0A8D8VRA4_9HEMI